MALLTDYAVRRKGEEMAIRYCVMCLADGDKTPAVCVAELSEGTEAGYCKPCGETMVRTGHKLKPLPAENRKKWTGKLTDAQRREIVESPESGAKLAKRYGVTGATISHVRKKAKEEAANTAQEFGGSYHQVPTDSGVYVGIERHVTHIPITAQELVNDAPVLAIEEEMPIEEVKRRFPMFNVPGEPWAPVPMQPNAFFDSIQPEDMPPAVAPDEPDPVSRNREALRRVLEEESAPDAAIVFHVTEAKADRIWYASTLQTKLEFARGELFNRLEAL
jgi:hypothetical protein